MNNTRNKELLISFGKHLAKLRRGKALTQRSIAFKCNIEISQISRIERGILNPTLSTLHVIAESMDSSLKELMDFDQADN